MFLYFKIFIARATVKLVQKQALVAHYAELGTHRNSYAEPPFNWPMYTLLHMMPEQQSEVLPHWTA